MRLRHSIPALLFGLTLAAGCGGDEPRTNVILITLDTTRADFLSCYGAPWAHTPALDQLAEEGALFQRAIASSSVTPVSHATILTGRFNAGHGLRVLSSLSGYRLPPDVPTLASAFQDAGYATHAIHSAFPVSRYFGFDRAFDSFDDLTGALQRRDGADKTQWDVDALQRRSDATIDRVVEKLSGEEQPFFLWLHLWDPHDNLRIPPVDVLREATGAARAAGLTDEEDILYAAEVAYQDSQLGRLFAALEAQDLAERTIVAVTADHGQGLSDGQRLHGWRRHRMVYREQLHVPLILRGPGIPTGSKIDAQVRTADVAPTLLELARIPADALEIEGVPLDGESLTPLLRGTETAHRVAYADQINGYDHNAGMRRSRPDAAFLFSLSDGDWKVIFRPHMPERSELFHLASDPLEEHDVRAEHPGEYYRLVERLAEMNPWVTGPFPLLIGGGTEGESEGADDDIESDAALAALGYSAAGLDSEVDWWWTCPEHGDHRSEKRGRHDEGGCGRALVPRTVWVENEGR